ncbi:MAG: ribosome maturation factor RimM, partial [Tepidiformaceae bacterium]
MSTERPAPTPGPGAAATGLARLRGSPRPARRNPHPQEPQEGFTAVGRVLRAHGLKGELRVQAFAEGAPNLQRGRPVFLGGERRVVTAARAERDAWLLQLSGIGDRTAAEPWRGALLETPDGDVRRADAESYFVHELVGLNVVTAEGRDLGMLAEVLQSGEA